MRGRKSFPARPKAVLLLGSGALQIGQAGEFDYSGSQALKALREEGVRAVLLNPNIATVQTSEQLADATYLLPVTPEVVESIIRKEHVDAILLGFGGQTALNCGLRLHDEGILARHGVSVLGTSVAAIRTCEDRGLFSAALSEIDVHVARGKVVTSVAEALVAAQEVGFPLILRAGFSLGGSGSAIVRRADDLPELAERALRASPQILVEESLFGWKEIEYEVVRDAHDHCMTVCNMENFDPVGIHTGDSIVVAPSQTLSDHEYQHLREISIRTIRHLDIVGECNIQYALHPETGDYRVIEVNPRLSRSSALASKATGYPLAYVAAKIALGHSLTHLTNSVTRSTSAFFEPALDYVVCKVPRWDFAKFDGVADTIGTEMRSVGEVMAIGRSFAEVIQKALRMLDVGALGLDSQFREFADLDDALRRPTPHRIFAIAQALSRGATVDSIAQATGIDRYFLSEIEGAVALEHTLRTLDGLSQLDPVTLRSAKELGFSDAQLARALRCGEEDVRQRRAELSILPRLARIDTMAGEYPAPTNYLYLTYAAEDDDVPPFEEPPVFVLGSGCYRIGSSVEFDECCVRATQAAHELGFQTLLLNCNPETVSTDYDLCSRLVFDEISVENVLSLWNREAPVGVLVSMSGQTPNNLAVKLSRAGVRLLGTSAESIDLAENRKSFSSLCDRLGVQQPAWREVTELHDLDALVAEVGGFPVLVRPSYVLSGAAMRVAYGSDELREFVTRAARVSSEYPLVLSKFERHAREIEFDAVARDGQVELWAVSEHIEDAGVHSGDATLVFPPQRLYLETIRRVRREAAKLARALAVTGPFNVQFLAKNNEVKVIEVNLRASRSFPFVSKGMGISFAAEAMRAIMGAPGTPVSRGRDPLERDYVVVKASQFSFRRLAGADPLLGVEMASTGEVGCFGDDVDEALLKALMSTGFRIPRRGVLLSLGPMGDKYRFVEEARMLRKLDLALFATGATADMLASEGIVCEPVGKTSEPDARLAVDVLRDRCVDLVINIPRERLPNGVPEGGDIRRLAIELGIPLITEIELARAVARAVARYPRASWEPRAWTTYC